MTHDNVQREEGELLPDKPGSLLKKARTAISLTEIDLATRLRLDVRLVEALEADDYDALPAPTFVKGYIRSIAKELGINADPIVIAYDTHAPQEAPPLTDFVTRAPIQITSSDKLVKGATFGVVIILVLMVGLWWHARNADQPGEFRSPDFLADSEVSGEVNEGFLPDLPATPLPYSYTIVEHPTDPFSVSVDNDSQTGDVSPGVTDEPLSASSSDEIAPAVDDIRITANEDAWVEVRDGAGERLFFGHAKPGIEINLGSRPPYSLVIGNSEEVTLNYRGRIVDLDEYSFQGVARLELE